MKAFRFRLQSILTLREEEEEEAQRVYARGLRAVERLEEDIAAVHRDFLAAGTPSGSGPGGGVPAEELQRLARYRMVLQLRLEALALELQRARETAETARLALLAASQKRQALDKYRDRLRRTHDGQQARLERILLDDLSGRSPTLLTGWRQGTDSDPSLS